MQTSLARTAWITGGGSGIGQALCLKLVRAGWTVAVSGRRPEALQETARLAAGNVHAYPLDVSDLKAMRQTAARIESELGPLQLVVLNAGMGQFVKLDNLRAETFATHMQVNYLGVVNGIDAVLSAFRRRRTGHFVIVASVAGYRGIPRAAAYGPTKAALINLAECLRFDLQREGIKISVCNPGFVETPMTAENRVPMPFLMNLQDATEALYRGIMKQKFEIIFPRRFVLLLKLFRCLPYMFYFPVIRKFTGR
ncbi:MAG TPA: SDR family NAD(P)-dependent oxidoreductase [Gammaproteobacteria bacterium]|nr:SDR family NAD(P)-dependent oxidoreductase [Gammaproteobacteria bacterium]